MTIDPAVHLSADRNAAKTALQHAGTIDLRSLLHRLVIAGQAHDEVTVDDLVRVVGRRSFAPILLTVSLLGFSPLGGVPGAPSTLAVIVILVAGQIALGFKTLWLPHFLRRKTIRGSGLTAAAAFLKPAAAIVDRLIRPRLVFLTEGPFSRLIAFACVVLSLAMPPLELVPLVDIPLWGVITAFSLALATHDGVLAVIALLLTPVSVYLIASSLF